MTMTFTVSDALRTGRLREAQVRAGAAGLTRRVASVNVMEVPDILPWVKAHELLLTTLYPLRDVPGALDDFVTELARLDLAGIVVKTGRYFDAIPEEMCTAAERAGLPLIELRCEVSFDEIITDLLGQILSVQTQRLQRSEEVHRRFTGTVLTGGGLQHIAENLTHLIDNPVVIIAPDRRVLALASPDDAGAAALDACVRTEVGQRYLGLDTTAAQARGDSTVSILRCTPRIQERQITCFVCPIRVGTQHYGSIIVLAVNRPFEDDDAVALEHAVTVSALTITRDQAILAVERKFQSDFLDDLLAGRITALEIIQARSQTLGWNLERPCVVCVAEIHDEQGTAQSHWRGNYLPGDTALLESARAAARYVDAESIVMEKSGQLMFILGAATGKPGESNSTTGERSFQSDVEMGQHLLRGLRFLQRERRLILGIGRRCESALELHRSYKEARQAVAVGSKLRGAGTVIHFNDLGFQRILSQFENRAELHAFADELLGALETYDRRHHTDLLPTLETLLNSNLNMAVTARLLHLHYNSLRYRLQKIEELTGPFMNDAHQRMNLELALQIRKTGRE
jgi:purine catabolism regulator